MVSKPCILRHGHLGPKPSTTLCFLPDEGYFSRSPPQNRGSGGEGHVWGAAPRCTDRWRVEQTMPSTKDGSSMLLSRPEGEDTVQASSDGCFLRKL